MHGDGVYRFRDFRPISGYLRKTTQNRALVTMKRYALYRTVTCPMTLSYEGHVGDLCAADGAGLIRTLLA